MFHVCRGWKWEHDDALDARGQSKEKEEHKVIIGERRNAVTFSTALFFFLLREIVVVVVVTGDAGTFFPFLSLSLPPSNVSLFAPQRNMALPYQKFILPTNHHQHTHAHAAQRALVGLPLHVYREREEVGDVKKAKL